MKPSKRPNYFLAPSWRRANAYLTDTGCYIALIIGLSIPAEVPKETVFVCITKVYLSEPYLIPYRLLSIILMLAPLAFAILLSTLSATPGQMLYGILTKDENGRSLSLTQALVKGYGGCLSLFLGACPLITGGWSVKGQNLIDRLAGTYVVQKRTSAANEPRQFISGVMLACFIVPAILASRHYLKHTLVKEGVVFGVTAAERAAYYQRFLNEKHQRAAYVTSDHCRELAECLEYLSSQPADQELVPDLFTARSVVLYQTMPEQHRRDFLPFGAQIVSTEELSLSQAKISYKFTSNGTIYKAMLAMENGRWRIDLWSTIGLYH